MSINFNNWVFTGVCHREGGGQNDFFVTPVLFICHARENGHPGKQIVINCAEGKTTPAPSLSRRGIYCSSP